MKSMIWVLAVAVAGCTCGGPSGPGASVRGIVSGVDGQPLEGVAVVGAFSSATTDATGRYTLRASPGANTVRFAAAGYVAVVKSLTAVETLPTMLHITMLAAAPAVQLSSADGGVVRGASGASVMVPASAFVVGDGRPVAEQVSVRVTNLDPTTAAIRRTASGDFSAETGAGVTMLESTGMLDVDVRSNGQRAAVAPGKQLELRMPVAQGVSSPSPTMELWSFDEARGRWVSEGTATYEASTRTYVARVGHLSLWNTDKPYLATCLAGRVVDEDGRPLAGAHVQSSGVDYIGASDTVSGADGVFRIAVRKSSSVDVIAQHQLGGGESRLLQTGSDGTAVPPTATDACADGGVWTAKKDVFTSEEGTVSCDAIRDQAPSQCLADFVDATRCFQPAGACVMTSDSAGALVTYASGSSMSMDLSGGSGMPSSSYFGADGRLCYRTVMALQGLSFEVTYTMADGRTFRIVNGGGSITCPDGSSVNLNGDQQAAAQACAPQGTSSSGGQQCTYQGPGTCTATADCAAAAQVCCAFSGVKTCTTPPSCASVDGGVLP